MKKVVSYLFALLIFLIPSNLFLVLTEEGSRVHGLRVDYLLPRLYLSDLVVFACTFAIFFASRKVVNNKELLQQLKTHRSWQIAVGLFITIVAVQLFSATPLLSFWLLSKVMLFVCFLFCFWQRSELLIKSKVTELALGVTIVFQSFVGLLQFIQQQSLAGYWFLGETDISSFAGLAKTTLGGVERVLPYGTTAHPNVLGGVLAVYLLLFLKLEKNRKSLLFVTTTVLGTLCLLLTQSLTAYTTFLLGVVWFFSPRVQKHSRVFAVCTAITLTVLSLALPLLPSRNPSIHRRNYLSAAGLYMFIDNPLTGVGLGAFTNQVEKYSITKEVVRFVQPTHNVVVLFLAEGGLICLLAGVFYLNSLEKKRKHAVLRTTVLFLPILLFDHYPYTLQTGQLLFILALLFSPIFFDKKTIL